MAVANQALGPASLGVDLGDVSDTIQFDLGAQATGEDGCRYIYVRAAMNIALSDAVAIAPGFLASKITKTLVDTGATVGCVPTLNTGNLQVPTQYYFWACVSGAQSVNCITGSTASVSPVYTTGTAGALGTASGSQTLIRGIVFSAANSSGATASRAAVLNMPQASTF